ncbi:hypothetical protein CAEBREN_03733 [Caenorhabditis brenneri]|uniref:Uncharacterized protein n=1 Tax=Caenorhabditis brenneri TaxID=135651 RepID=G0NNL7_CAEBE|nr:hypothetical protein CAEBREN_03733 [Caenorhabditis brenneri]
MPSPVKSSGCRKIFSLDMESSEVDDGKNTVQDQEKNQTISGQPERVQFDDAAINAYPPSTPIIKKDPLISGQKESLMLDYTAYQIHTGHKSPSFVGLTKMDGSMSSEAFSNFEKSTLRVMKSSELNKMSTSSIYSQCGEDNQPCLLCQDPTIIGQSMKSKKTQLDNSQMFHNATVNSSSSPKFQNHNGSAFSTFEEVAADGILKSDSGRVENTQSGKINKTAKKANLHFHPFKTLNVQKEQKPQSSQPIDVTEEAPKDIDDFWFGAQSVGQDFDWTYMRNFKQMYEEDRWENYSYEIGHDEPNHDASTPTSPTFN